MNITRELIKIASLLVEPTDKLERIAIRVAKKELTEEEQKALDNRRRKKVKGVRALAENITKLRHRVTRDLNGENEKDRMTALAIALMDRTAERVGNDASAQDGHVGVTGLQKKHVMVKGDTINLKYTGKSGVEHDKSFTHKRIAELLKEQLKKCEKDDDFVLSCGNGYKVKADRVNRYLEDFGVTAKDIRGYAANQIVTNALKRIKVPDEEKDRKKKFLEIAGNAAEEVGHGREMLRKQYLLPNLEDQWIKHGKVVDLKTASATSTTPD